MSALLENETLSYDEIVTLLKIEPKTKDKAKETEKVKEKAKEKVQ